MGKNTYQPKEDDLKMLSDNLAMMFPEAIINVGIDIWHFPNGLGSETHYECWIHYKNDPEKGHTKTFKTWDELVNFVRYLDKN